MPVILLKLSACVLAAFFRSSMNSFVASKFAIVFRKWLRSFSKDDKISEEDFESSSLSGHISEWRVIKIVIVEQTNSKLSRKTGRSGRIYAV
jgi:hypothetical protein